MKKMNANLDIAIRASIAAGNEIMNVYNSEFDYELKEDNSPLTEADKKANDIINSFLIPTGIPIISEENKQLDYSERKNWNLCWIVDPLDGTKEFIKRNGEFTVNIALVNNGKPVLGVIYVPETKELYVGNVQDKNAYKVVIEDSTWSLNEIIIKSIALKRHETSEKTIRLVGSRSHMSDETLAFMKKIKLNSKKKKKVI